MLIRALHWKVLEFVLLLELTNSPTLSEQQLTKSSMQFIT